MRNRVILGVRGGFLKEHQEPGVTSALWATTAARLSGSGIKKLFGEGKRQTRGTRKRHARKSRKRVDHQKEAVFNPHQQPQI